MVSQPKLSTFLGSSRQQYVYMHNYMYVYTYIICTNICAREDVHGAGGPSTSQEGVPPFSRVPERDHAPHPQICEANPSLPLQYPLRSCTDYLQSKDSVPTLNNSPGATESGIDVPSSTCAGLVQGSGFVASGQGNTCFGPIPQRIIWHGITSPH